MSWLYSRALVEEYSADRSSAGAPSAQSKLIPTRRAYCSPDRATVFCRLSRFGMMFGLLTEVHGAELLTWFLAGFPVRTSAQPEKPPGSKDRDPVSGPNSLASLARYDRGSRSWKTPQYSLLGDSESYSETWPRWGSMRDGACWELPMSGRRISGSGSGLFPTPTASIYGICQGGSAGRTGQPNRPSLNTMAKKGLWPTPTKSDGSGGPGSSGRHGGLNLRTAVTKWPTPHGFSPDGRSNGPSGNELGRAVNQARFPTPNATDGKGPSTRSQGRERPICDDDLPTRVGGSLNPTWVEWLMGWPLGWTDLDASATAKSPSAPPKPGACCLGD